MLLVDSDGDGVCDGINPAVEPGPGVTDGAYIVDLEAIPETGRAFFSDSIDPTAAGTPASAYGGVFSGCQVGNDSMAPPAECPASTPMTRVVPSALIGNPPGIYAKPPVDRDTTCVGDAFDFQAHLDEGWSCIVVRAEDNLGNVGVSPPLRTCFINGVSPEPCPGSVNTIAPESERPSCTDGCSLPPSFADTPDYQLVIPD